MNMTGRQIEACQYILWGRFIVFDDATVHQPNLIRGRINTDTPFDFDYIHASLK